MYTFKEIENISEYEKFCQNFSKAPIMQDYAWSKVKNNFDSKILGLYKNEELVAASLILIKNLPFGIKVFYASRGYLIDFENEELLEIFTKEIKKYAAQKGAYCVKIDPYVAMKEERIYPLEDEEYDVYSKNHKIIMENLKNAGYIHKGYKKNISAYLQPRFTMTVPLVNSKEEFVNEEYILKTMKKNVRGYLGDYHSKRGVFFYHTSDISKLKDFVQIINKTEERQNVALRNSKYFERIMKSFGERAILFFAEVDLKKYLNFIKMSLEEKNANIEFLQDQQEKTIKLIEERGASVITSAALVVLPPNKEGIKMAEFLYAGNDVSLLPNLKINNGLTYYRLLYCLENNYHYANLGGVDGSLEDHLSVFKSKFNPLVIEFIGEYDLPVNKILYVLISNFEPFLKKIYYKLARIIKR